MTKAVTTTPRDRAAADVTIDELHRFQGRRIIARDAGGQLVGMVERNDLDLDHVTYDIFLPGTHPRLDELVKHCPERRPRAFNVGSRPDALRAFFALHREAVSPPATLRFE